MFTSTFELFEKKIGLIALMAPGLNSVGMSLCLPILLRYTLACSLLIQNRPLFLTAYRTNLWKRKQANESSSSNVCKNNNGNKER